MLVQTRPGASDSRRDQERRGAWYPDPYGKADRRWWDGRKWTSEVRAEGDPDQPPVIADAPPAREHDEGPSAFLTASRTRVLVGVIAAAAAIVGVVFVVLALAGGSGSSQSAGGRPASASINGGAATSAPTAAAVSHAMSSAAVDQVSCVTDLGSAPRTIASLASTSGLQVPQARDRGPVYAYGCSGTSGTSYVAFVDRDATVIEYGQQRLSTEAQGAAAQP